MLQYVSHGIQTPLSLAMSSPVPGVDVAYFRSGYAAVQE